MQFLKRYFWLFTLSVVCFACGKPDPSENTEFLKAVRQSKTEQINQLLSQDAELLTKKTEKKGLTPLHVAAQKADSETLTLLIDKGAKVNEPAKDGRTPLHFAVKRINGFAVARVLLEAGADPSLQDEDGRTPWDLIDQKSARSWFTEDESEILGLLLRYDYLPDTTLAKNQPHLLHRMAQKAKDADIIRILIEKYQLNPDVRDADGWTPLHYAAKGKNPVAAEILLEKGADINAQSTQPREEIKGREMAEDVKYKYPIGATPRDVYQAQGARGKTGGNSLYSLFRKYDGKRSKDL